MNKNHPDPLGIPGHILLYLTIGVIPKFECTFSLVWTQFRFFFYMHKLDIFLHFKYATIYCCAFCNLWKVLILHNEGLCKVKNDKQDSKPEELNSFLTIVRL